MKTQDELVEDIYQALIDAANKVSDTSMHGDREEWTTEFKHLRWDLINELHNLRRRVDQEFRVERRKRGD